MDKPNMTTVQLRASILLSQFVSFSDENVKRYSQLFKNSRVSKKDEPKGAWSIADDEAEVIFLPSRVNILSLRNMTEDEELKHFIEMIKRVYTDILLQENIKVRLFSYSPVLAYENTESFTNEIFFGSLLKVNTINGIKPSTTGIQEAFHISRTLPSGKYIVNHIVNFSDGIKTTRTDGVEKNVDCLMVELEFNVPLKKDGYNTDDLQAFLDQADNWKKEIINAYFEAL